MPTTTLNLVIDIDGYFAPAALTAAFRFMPRLLAGRWIPVRAAASSTDTLTVNVAQPCVRSTQTAEAYALNATVVPPGAQWDI